MTHRSDSRTLSGVLEALIANGFEGMAEAMSILFNEAMQLKRSAFLEAGPYERSEDRRGWANGFKPKTMRTRVGELALQIPQVRDLEPGSEGFYPKSLERGLRSERALKLAISRDVRARCFDAPGDGDHARAVRPGRELDAGVSIFAALGHRTRVVAHPVLELRAVRDLGCAVREGAARWGGGGLRGAGGDRSARGWQADDLGSQRGTERSRSALARLPRELAEPRPPWEPFRGERRSRRTSVGASCPDAGCEVAAANFTCVPRPAARRGVAQLASHRATRRHAPRLDRRPRLRSRRRSSALRPAGTGARCRCSFRPRADRMRHASRRVGWRRQCHRSP